MSACSLAVAAGLTVNAFAPFDISVQVSELKAAIKNARLVPFGPTLDGAAVASDGLAVGQRTARLDVCRRPVRDLAAREGGKRGRSSDSARCARGRWPLPGHRVDAARHPEPSV